MARFAVGCALAIAAVSVAAAAPPARADGPQPTRKPDPLAVELAALPDPGQPIPVEILVGDGADARVAEQVAAVGGHVTGSVPGYIVQAELPAGAYPEVRALDGVVAIRRPVPQGYTLRYTPQALAGAELDHVNAAAWHAAGFRGQGVKIGIVDGFSATAWNSAVASGDLPVLDATHTRCVGLNTPGEECDIWSAGVRHGVAVAELVHEMAPDAKLYIASAFSASDLQTVVEWFVANGVTIVNRSLGAPFDGPGDGTGPLGAVADYAAAHGIAWFNSAGNEAGRDGHRGTYYRATFTDDGTGRHAFVAPPEGSEVPAGGPYPRLHLRCDGYLNASLRWDDWAATHPTDLDLFAYTERVGGTLLTSSELDQSQPDVPPVETLGVTCSQGSAVYLEVRAYAPGDGTDDLIEIFGEAPLEVWSNPYSAGYPIVDSANPAVFGIGATEADHSIAYYSSEGPTNDGRTKPDFTARSHVATTAMSNFQGTSASAPVAAGMAAVVQGAGLVASPMELREWLLANAAHDRGTTGPDNVFGYGELVLPDPLTTPEPPSPPAAPALVAVEPARLLDTRDTNARAAAGATTVVPIAGRGDVPTGARGAVVNITAVDPAEPGYVTAFPCGGPVPTASHVNYLAGEVVANNVTVALDDAGQLCLFTLAATDLVVDVSGYVPSDSPTALFAPRRVLDTRTDGAPLDGSRSVQITGLNGVPTGATTAVVSVTAIAPEAAGFLTLYPCTGDPTETSTVNFDAGEFVPNGAIVELSTTGALCVYASTPTHVALDLAGAVPANATLATAAPSRLLDTRLDGGPLAAGRSIEVQVTGQVDVPADAIGAIVNVATVGPAAPGYLTVWPCDSAPTTSSVNNATAGIVRANNAVVPLSPRGTLCVFTLTDTDVILDITAWLTP